MWCQADGSPRHSRRASSGSKENWPVDVLTSRRDVRKRRLLQKTLLKTKRPLAEFSRADINDSDNDEETTNDFEKENKKSDSFEGESSNKRDSSMQCEAQCNMQCCDMQCDANKIYDMQFVDKYKSSVVQNTGINYSDIESAISKFNAESHENIANWLDHFENISQLFSLSDLQKFIFAKRSLGGTAALFVRTEPQINSWQKLKQALIDEFSFEINSAHLHELLSKRKMRDSESAPEYFLKMKELCSSGKIEDAALMHYVIKGINDRQENKTILYGCKNLLEFKEKLKVYEVIKSDYSKSKAVFDKTKARYDSNPRFNSFDKLKSKQGHDDRFNSKNESANKHLDVTSSFYLPQFEEGIERVERVPSIASEYGSRDQLLTNLYFLKKRIEFWAMSFRIL
ncbi:hypothetical protein AVEN_135099-1 [Araneus ventricosus]|uniref:Retrotransposon gag domain-containing protein n=1 Tax=Araneus ventricosus TaxID=182803 RepID=A0A4Y2M506_ARAVE|nr:hypothetical protein AVEN_135099-1 [Araneus ventricosus]